MAAEDERDDECCTILQLPEAAGPLEVNIVNDTGLGNMMATQTEPVWKDGRWCVTIYLRSAVEPSPITAKPRRPA